MARPLADQIIARMLRVRDFLISMRDDGPQTAVDVEFYPGAWDDLSPAEQQYFQGLDYQAIINSQDALDQELGPYSSSYFFITD
ncbi:MAG: hypothetical protein ACW98U_10645 [Candidatus Thorarchaeota archaeon]|jgi:hypothetical protein